MALRVEGGKVAFERDDDVIFVPFNDGEGGDLEGEVNQLAFYFRATTIFSDSNANLSNLGADGQVFIWAHGNKSRNYVGAGNSRKTASDVANELSGMGLPKATAATVVLWSCFAGVSGGFADSLWLNLKRLGHQSTTVYGPKYATGSMVDFNPAHRYLRGLDIYNPRAKSSSKAGILNPGPAAPGGWHGTKSLATPDDMRSVSSAAMLRSAEV